MYGHRHSSTSSRHSACSNCWLRTFCLPGSSISSTLRRDALARHDTTLPAKGVVFTQDSPFTTCFVVKSGTIKTFNVNERGDEKVLGFYLPGQMFGFDGLATGMHGCSAIALERSMLCRLSLRRLEEPGQETGELAYCVLKAVSDELNRAERMNRWLSRNTAEERVIGFLMEVAYRYRVRQLRETHLHLAMSRSEIANYLGLALETVSRTLTRLHRHHLIDVHGRNVQLLQMEQLKNRICRDDYQVGEGDDSKHERPVFHWLEQPVSQTFFSES